MSYQAITDIIVNQSQVPDYNLSAAVKDSPNSSSSVSFAELLTSYNKEESSVETPEKAEPEKINEPAKAENTEKSEKTSETKVEKETQENQPEKTSEKAVEKTDNQVSETKTDDKNENSAKPTVKNEPKAEVTEKLAAADSEKKNSKSAKNAGKDKKLTEKDFSRLNQITENAENLAESAQKAAAATNVSNLEKSTETKGEEEPQSAELAIAPDSSAELGVNQLGEDNKADTSSFDFSGGEEKGRKTFALDKEGKITVEDQRTKVEGDANNQLADSKKSAIKSSEIKLTNDSTAVMSLELNPNAEADVLSLNTQTAASNGSNFQAMLSNQLSNVAPEFVKAGNLVLKDNNQGTINLVLHPDDLGNVKIHLSLDGKTLSGHITVATKEALQVFKDNAETLREAFIKNGFDAANFDVAMNNGGSFNQSSGFEGQDNGNNLFAKRAYGDSAASLSAELESILDNAEDISNYSVNIVA